MMGSRPIPIFCTRPRNLAVEYEEMAYRTITDTGLRRIRLKSVINHIKVLRKAEEKINN